MFGPQGNQHMFGPQGVIQQPLDLEGAQVSGVFFQLTHVAKFLGLYTGGRPFGCVFLESTPLSLLERETERKTTVWEGSPKK